MGKSRFCSLGLLQDLPDTVPGKFIFELEGSIPLEVEEFKQEKRSPMSKC